MREPTVRVQRIRRDTVKFRLIVFGLYIIESCFIQPGANTQAHLGGFLMGAILGVVNIIVLKNNKNMEGLA